MTVEALVESVSNLTVGELVALTKALQDKFDVKPFQFSASPINTVVTETVEVVEPTEFDLYITSAGDRKIQVIKRVRELTTLGLKEAKDLVDHLPAPMKSGIGKEEAEKLKAALESEGAVVEIRPI